MKHQSQSKNDSVRVTVDPGICGFPCVVEARKKAYGVVSLNMTSSECKQIKRLSQLVTEITLKELFKPITRNPVYVSAQRAGCHPSCLVPVAILKAAEVAMEMALPRDAQIRFES